MQDFRQLLVWKRAHTFALNVRRAAQALPRVGYTDLKSQMTRAAQSIVDFNTTPVHNCRRRVRQNASSGKPELEQARPEHRHQKVEGKDARGPWH